MYIVAHCRFFARIVLVFLAIVAGNSSELLAQNLIVNSGFDHDLSGWVASAATWDPGDMRGSTQSGSMRLQGGVGGYNAFTCVATTPGTTYYVKAYGRSNGATVTVTAAFLPDPCPRSKDEGIRQSQFGAPVVYSLSPQWIAGTAHEQAPVATALVPYAGVTLFVAAHATGTGSANIDDVYIGTTPPPERKVSLTVMKTGTGSGNVSGNGVNAAINCGSVCVTTVPDTSTDNFRQQAEPGSVFVGFSGDCFANSIPSGCTLLPKGTDRVVSAQFDRVPGGVSPTIVPLFTAASGAIVYSTTAKVGSSEYSAAFGDLIIDTAASGENVLTALLKRQLRLKLWPTVWQQALSLVPDLLELYFEAHDPLRVVPVLQNASYENGCLTGDADSVAGTFTAIIAFDFLDSPPAAGFSLDQYTDPLTLSVMESRYFDILTVDELRKLDPARNYIVIPAAAFDFADIPRTCLECFGTRANAVLHAHARRGVFQPEFDATVFTRVRNAKAPSATTALQPNVATQIASKAGIGNIQNQVNLFFVTPDSSKQPGTLRVSEDTSLACEATVTVRESTTNDILTTAVVPVSGYQQVGAVWPKQDFAVEVLTPCSGISVGADIIPLIPPRRRAVR